ncbi:EamA family transporter [Sphingomonas sp. ASV193]|uniref:EamA family transporter n=1 Tax=Sphingomonas sp. ASV193 TaxID=3144405 RepID=UPI0032E8A8CA
MSWNIFLIVLLAALLHAGWNALVRRGTDKLKMMMLVMGLAALGAAMALPFLPAPAPTSWPFMAASAILQLVYFGLLARIYRTVELNVAYPLMRGLAPALVAIAGLFLLTERLSFAGWAGLFAICGGLLALSATARAVVHRRDLRLALLNALVIAGYTLVDGLGVRRSGAPFSYVLWIYFLSGLSLTLSVLASRRDLLFGIGARDLSRGSVGALGTVAAYSLAAWAMTRAPIAAVAALRETSIVFAALLSVLFLGERVDRRRWAAISTIAIGAVLLRLG